MKLEAEQAVLGSILIDSRCLAPVLRIVRTEHFDGVNRYLFGVIVEMFNRSQEIDPVLVLNAAVGDECPLGDEELRSYIMQLMEITPTSANAERYARIVRDQANVAQIHARAAEMSMTNDLPSLRRMLHQASEAVMDRQTSATTSMSDALRLFFDKCDDGREWLRWPFAALNDRLFVRRGDYVLLGAESSVGKTAIALQLATYWAKQGQKVGFFSLETDDEDITDRMMAGFLGVDMQTILRNKLDDVQYAQAAHLSSELSKLPFGIVNASSMTAADIATRALTDGIDIAIIDYLQLIRPTGGATREREVAEISMSLKNFGRTAGVTMVILAQLNRGTGEQTEPTLDRIRDSGQPRQDADIAFLLWLKKAHAAKDDPDFGKRVLRIAKNKRGPLAHVNLAFDGPRQLFYPTNTNGPKPLFRLPQPEQMEMGI